MSYITSPNMGLQIPAVGGEPGPTFATDINNSLTLIDQHSHLPGSGVLITPGAININAALTFNNNFATSIAGVTLQAQTSTPVNSTVYESGNDLYFTDGVGNNVRITQSGGVAGSPGSISNLTSPASAAYVSADSTFVWQSNTNIAANLDAGSLLMRNLTPNSTFALTLQPPASLASNYSITLPAIPSSTLIMSMTNGGIMAANVSVDNTSIQLSGNVLGVTSAISQGVVPTGSIIAYGGLTAPAGYLMCDGTLYNTSSFPALYSAINVYFGGTIGVSFNVPDMRGMFARGVAGSSGRDPDTTSRIALYAGGNTGNNVGSQQASAFASHTHSIVTPGGASVPGGGTQTIVNQSVGTPPTFNTTAAGGSAETRPINVYVNYIIKT